MDDVHWTCPGYTKQLILGGKWKFCLILPPPPHNNHHHRLLRQQLHWSDYFPMSVCLTIFKCLSTRWHFERCWQCWLCLTASSSGSIVWLCFHKLWLFLWLSGCVSSDFDCDCVIVFHQTLIVSPFVWLCVLCDLWLWLCVLCDSDSDCVIVFPQIFVWLCFVRLRVSDCVSLEFDCFSLCQHCICNVQPSSIVGVLEGDLFHLCWQQKCNSCL